MTNSFEQKLDDSLTMMQRLYLNADNDRDWAVAWSGGKDSTVVMSLVVKMLEYLPPELRKRKIHAVMSDTKIENPELGAYMSDQVSSLNKYAAQKGIPIRAQTVSRPAEKSYFALTLGRGYFLPQNNGAGRWCTGRLKLEPQNEALKAVNPSHILIGTRLSESLQRAESIRKWTVSERIGEHANLSETNTFMVIVDWTVEDIWRYLSDVNLGWTSTTEVRRLYKEATGECGINNPKGVEVKAAKMEACGARFGCWLCPVITSDRSTEEMTKYHGWMEPLTEFRQVQAKVYGSYVPPRPKGQSAKDRSKSLRRQEAINEKVLRITKAGYNRQGKRMKNGQGTFTVEARNYLFYYLIDTQKLVNRLRSYDGLEPLELISSEEIAIIKALWAEDYADYPLLVGNVEGIPISELDALIDGEISEMEVSDYIERRAKKLADKKAEVNANDGS